MKDEYSETLNTSPAWPMLTRVFWDLQEHLSTLITQSYLDSAEFETPIPLFTIKAVSPFQQTTESLSVLLIPGKTGIMICCSVVYY